MQRRVGIILVVLLLIAVAGAFAWRLAPHRPLGMYDAKGTVPVSRFTLDNGMTVVVMPNDRIPAVAHILFVKAGGADDPTGKSGLAHYLEHLMFTGTAQFPEGEYDHFISRLGGKQNAYTTHDFTGFYVVIAKDQLPEIMKREADRLQHLTLDPERAARELKVITEERNMRVENNPAALLMEQIDAATFLNHPYHQPLIGWPSDMASFTVEDARDFYQRNYVPSNLLLVVAGDVDVRDVRRYAQQYYGGMRGPAAPTRNWPKEPPHRVSVSLSMTDDKAHEKRLIRQYVAPSLQEGDAAQIMPLSVLAQYLGDGEGGLLYRKLVLEQKVATGVAVDYDELALGPALFHIVVTPAPGIELPQLEMALDSVLVSVRSTVPDEADIRRAKVGLKADMIFAQDGLLPLARFIGHLYMAGKDEQYFYQWPQAIEAVTPEQAEHAAQLVLAPEHRVTGYLLPTNENAASPSAPLRVEDSNVR